MMKLAIAVILINGLHLGNGYLVAVFLIWAAENSLRMRRWSALTKKVDYIHDIVEKTVKARTGGQ